MQPAEKGISILPPLNLIKISCSRAESAAEILRCGDESKNKLPKNFCFHANYAFCAFSLTNLCFMDLCTFLFQANTGAEQKARFTFLPLTFQTPLKTLCPSKTVYPMIPSTFLPFSLPPIQFITRDVLTRFRIKCRTLENNVNFKENTEKRNFSD